MTSSTEMVTFRTYDESVEVLEALFNSKEDDAAEDEDTWVHSELRMLSAQSPHGGTFPSKSTRWYCSPTHKMFKVPSASLGVMERQALNLLSVTVFGCVSGDPKLGALGKMTATSTRINLKVATLIKGMITLQNPPGYDTDINYVFQDQAVAFQEQYDRFLQFQDAHGNKFPPDCGFMLPGYTTGDTAKFQLQVGPLYRKRPGKLSDTPTLARSPRKRKADTQEGGSSQPTVVTSTSRHIPTTQEGLIRQQEVEVPRPIAGVTTYDPAVMPGFQPDLFESPEDMVVNQLNVIDIDDSLVRPWALQSVLVEGALLTARVNLVAWVIREKIMCHLVAEEIKVYHRPGQPLCAIIPADVSIPSQPTGTTELPSGGKNKHAKGNDGARVTKTTARDKGKGKAKDKEPVEEVDWDFLN